MLTCLEEATYESRRNGNTIRGAGVIDLAINTPRLLLQGGAQSGKTALAKMLFRHLHEGGYIPVYLDRARHLPSGQVNPERMHAHLAGVFAKQYDPSATQAYEQLDRSRRVVIVDDYHHLQRNRKVRAAFIDALTRVAGKVILLADQVAMEANELLDPASRAEAMDFETYNILPFGHARRGELIDRWLLLGGRAQGNATEIAQRRVVLTRTINDFIGRSWLPPYPVYILSLLQLRDDLTPSDTRIDTHGAYYELFIRNTLASVLTPKESAFVLTYLAHLAYQFLLDGVEEVDIATFNRIHRAYEQRFEIEPEVGRTREKLVECGILHRSGDAIRFRYPYIYYYFVALWIRDHIADQDIRAKIAELSRSLYIQEHADILLFLAHLSKDRVIVDELLTAARTFYPDVAPAEFAEDVKFLSRLGPTTSELVYQEHDLDEERARHLVELDEHEAEARKRGDNGGVRHGQPSDVVTTFTTALSTVQILGQVLRNHPGDLEGNVKLNIARECCSLGLRALTSLYDVFHRHEADILADAADAVREQSPEIRDPRKIEENAQRMLVALAEFLGFAVVRSIAAAIGTSELDLTYERLVALDKAPAVRLVRMSIDIDHSGHFPQLAVKSLARDLRDAPFAYQILKYLVISYFYMFPVPVKVRQSVCSALDIKYAALMGVDSNRKMLN